MRWYVAVASGVLVLPAACAQLTGISDLENVDCVGVCGGDGGLDAAEVDAPAEATEADAPAVEAPRPISPLTMSKTTSRRPRLRWELLGEADSAHVELCRDRECNDLILTFDAAGSFGEPPSPLDEGMIFWRLRGRVDGAVGAETSPTWALIIPPNKPDAPGIAAWGNTADFNGDGFTDVAIGAAQSNRLYVYYGSSSGISSQPNTSLIAPKDGQFGDDSVVSDFDGDGYSDLAVLAPSAQSGEVYVYSGRPQGLPLSPDRAVTPASGESAAFVAAPGDLDGDGYGEIAIADWQIAIDAYSSGRIRVFRGGPDGPETTSSLVVNAPVGINGAGWAIVGIGDVNADGYVDFASGTYAENVTLIFHGGPDGISATPTSQLTGGGGQFGWAVDAADDLNGDGYADIIIGALQASSSAGRAFAYFGSASGIDPASAIELSAGTQNFGHAVAGAGDVDGDGYADVLVGAETSNEAFLFRGSSIGVETTPAGSFTGTGRFGGSLSGVGDVYRDGTTVIAIASAQEWPGFVRTYRWSGLTASLDTILEGPSMEFGRKICRSH